MSTPYPGKGADKVAMIEIRARVKKKDPEAINFLGEQYVFGELGLQKDMQKAVELWEEAAGLGSVRALYNLGLSYCRGEGVKEDKTKGIQFYTKAAMQGHDESRYFLGCFEGENGNYDRSVRHLLISAKTGHKDSVQMIKSAFMGGIAPKEQYAQALTGYQHAVKKMKSHDRDEAKRLIEMAESAGPAR